MIYEDNSTTVSIDLDNASIDHSDTTIGLTNEISGGRLELTREEVRLILRACPRWWIETTDGITTTDD